jgi:hypothetical protein
MIKLIIQNPYFNEEKAQLVSLKDHPRKLPGIKKIERLLIVDGSTEHIIGMALNSGCTA